jgi:hypothetical protein
MGKHQGRWAFLWDVIWRNPVTSTCVFLWSALSAADLTKSQFFPDKWQHWQVVAYLPSWSWGWWFALSFFLVFLAVWLGSFTKDRVKNEEMAALKNPLPILSIEIQEIFVIPSRRSDVFVLASVRNDSKTDTLIETYWAIVSVESGKQYHLEGPLPDTSSYSRTEMDYSEKPHYVVKSKSRLEDFSTQITRKEPLKYGLPVTGWLHFRVESGLDLPDLGIDMVKKFALCMRDSCVNSPMHAVSKEERLDNPSTIISQTGVFV